MPYPFAHPAAVIPLARFGVPSALAIGSIVPDLWYFVPLVGRDDSHGLAGLFWFCLPAGGLLYVVFHVLLKQPLIALLSPRLAAFTAVGLPRASWRAVALSIVLGALTHLAWDALAHANDHLPGHNWAQHASTLLGTAVLVAWLLPRLRRAPARPSELPLATRLAVFALLGVAAAASVTLFADWPAPELAEVKRFLRTGGIAALQASTLAIFAYALAFHLKKKR
jgi:hypothetical protein